MKLRIVITLLAAIAAASLTGCGGRGQAAVAPMGPAAKTLDTTQVLAQARQISEAGVPYAVDGGAVTLTDIADTTDAIPVNGT
jgi:hypothetical protein